MKISEIVPNGSLLDEADAQSADQQRLRALKVNATRAAAASKQEASRQKLTKAQQDLAKSRQTLAKAARPMG
jgi:hypothetical protein